MKAIDAKIVLQQAWDDYLKARAQWKQAIQDEAIETAEEQGFIVGESYDWGTDRPVTLVKVSRFVRADGFIGSIQLTLKVKGSGSAILFLDDIKLVDNQIVLRKASE